MGIGTQFISFHHRGQESLTQQIIALIDRLLSLHQLRGSDKQHVTLCIIVCSCGSPIDPEDCLR